MGEGARPVTADSVTQLDDGARGAVVLCGSHGGTFSGAAALAAGVRGIVFNDAGVGREAAGIAGLALLDAHGVPAGAVGAHRSRIGLATETAAGELAHVNATAAALGLAPGMPVAAFARRVADGDADRRVDVDAVAPETAARDGDGEHTAPGGDGSGRGVPDAAPDADGAAAATPTAEEHRTLIADGAVPVWALDSASMARPGDDGAILVTGSHAQLVGAAPAAALRARARLAVFNDAGGVLAPSRLDALDDQGIAAVAVAAASARIGDGRSSYADGVVSAVNRAAMREGARTDTRLRDLVAAVAELEDVSA